MVASDHADRGDRRVLAGADLAPVHGAGRSATPRPGLHRARRRDPAAHRGARRPTTPSGPARRRRCRRGRYARRSALRQHDHLVSRLVRRGGRRSERRARRARAAVRTSRSGPGDASGTPPGSEHSEPSRVSGPERAGGHHDHERRPVRRRAHVDHDRRRRQALQPARGGQGRPGAAPGRAPGDRAMTARSAPPARAGSRSAADATEVEPLPVEAAVVAPAREGCSWRGSSCRRSCSGSTPLGPGQARPARLAAATATSPSGPSPAAPRPRAALDQLPPAPTARNPVERADTVDAGTQLLRTMVADLRAMAPADGPDRRAGGGVAERLGHLPGATATTTPAGCATDPRARFLVDQRDGQAITVADGPPGERQPHGVLRDAGRRLTAPAQSCGATAGRRATAREPDGDGSGAQPP